MKARNYLVACRSTLITHPRLVKSRNDKQLYNEAAHKQAALHEDAGAKTAGLPMPQQLYTRYTSYTLMTPSMSQRQAGHARPTPSTAKKLSAHPVSQNTRCPHGTHTYTGGDERQMTHTGSSLGMPAPAALPALGAPPWGRRGGCSELASTVPLLLPRWQLGGLRVSRRSCRSWRAGDRP